MGVKKGYRIQLEGILKQLYPEDWMITPIMSWSLYQMAVTKFKENETKSSCIYNMNGPTDPQVGGLCGIIPDIRELKYVMFLSHGRQPEVNILQARTLVSPRFSK